MSKRFIYKRKVNEYFKDIGCGEERIQARKQFICFWVEGPAHFVLCKRREQLLRLTPTSKKDVLYSCLISLS